MSKYFLLGIDYTLTEEINYFTCYLSGDSRLWIESYEPGLNGRILGYNDDYSGSGDFPWGYNARVKMAHLRDFSILDML